MQGVPVLGVADGDAGGSGGRGIHVVGEAALIEALRALKAAGKTVIFVTHKTNLLGLSDTIMVLRDGVVASMGPRDQVLRQLVDASKVAQASAKA